MVNISIWCHTDQELVSARHILFIIYDGYCNFIKRGSNAHCGADVIVHV